MVSDKMLLGSQVNKIPSFISTTHATRDEMMTLAIAIATRDALYSPLLNKQFVYPGVIHLLIAGE